MITTKTIAQLPNASVAVREAISGLESVRTAFNETGKSFSGRACISDDCKEFVNSFLEQDHVARRLIKYTAKKNPAYALTEEQARAFLERYEEFLRRTNAEVSPVNKIFAYRILLCKLIQLSKALEIRPDNRVYGAVIRNENLHKIGQEKEFECFSESLRTLRHAVVHNPADPRAFMRKMIEDFESISKNPEFECLHDKPGLIRNAVLSNPKDPEEYLRTMLDKVNKILNSPELACLSGLKSVVRKVALNYEEPEEFLKLAMKQARAIRKEPEFKCFSDSGWIINYVVINNPNDARGVLRNIIRDSQTILSETEFLYFNKYPSKVYRALVFKRSVEKAREMLKKTIAQQTFAALTPS